MVANKFLWNQILVCICICCCGEKWISKFTWSLISTPLVGINNLATSISKRRTSSSSYSITKTKTFSQPKYMVTNYMFLKLGSSIKIDILGLHILSNTCKKEIKGRKTYRICCFIQTTNSLNLWSKKSSFVRLLGIIWNANDSQTSRQVEMIICKALESNQCPQPFITHPLTIADKTCTILHI